MGFLDKLLGRKKDAEVMQPPPPAATSPETVEPADDAGEHDHSHEGHDHSHEGHDH